MFEHSFATIISHFFKIFTPFIMLTVMLSYISFDLYFGTSFIKCSIAAMAALIAEPMNIAQYETVWETNPQAKAPAPLPKSPKIA